MLRFSSRRLLLAIFSVLILMAMTAGFPARAGGQLSEDAVQKLVDPDRILQVLQDDAAGNVPVIVEFGMPELPDAAAFEDAEARDAAHISAVHQAQDAILGRAFVEEGGASAALSEELNFKRMNYSPMFAITVNREMLARLAEDPAVLRIHQDGADEPMLNQGSPTSLARIGMPAAYTAGATGNGWRVAILDSGGRRTHKFLSSRIVSAACYNTNSANSSSLCPGGVTSSTNIDSANDCDNTTIAGCGHGTHVAGTAGGFNSSLLSGEPANGVARDGRLISINVFSRFNSGSCNNPLSNGCVLAVVSDQILGLERVFALRNSMNIAAVNMSLGGSTIFSSACDSDSRKSIIDQLRAAGIATVIAAGNGSSNAGISAPACISSAISVANSTKADVRWGSSNWHSLVDLVAPGTSIYASDVSGATGNTWSFKTGTSMAAPHVAGAFAALRTTSPDASVQQILNALKATGTNITSAGVTKPRINVNTARNHLGTPATITSPAQGTGIATASQTFTWSGGVGATQYWLYVGTTGVGSANILNANNGTSTSRTVSGLPASGTIFVRLWTLTASGWFTRDTTYTMGRRAVMSSPANGTGLSGSSATFNWTSGTNVSEYWLFVGTTGVGSANVLNTTTGSNTSRTVSGLPLTGTIYVRLWSRIGSTWHSLDYSYTGGLRAVVTSPSPGSGLSGSTATFSWSSGSNVNQYYLYVGNTGTGSSNILIENMGTTRSKLVTGLPLSGTINVRLWSRIGSTWHSIDHTYTGGLRAVMTSPTQGTPIVGSSVTLNWSTGVNVSEYWVFVGSTGVGSSNILSASTGTTRTRTVTGLPASGTVFVRLWSRVASTWHSIDYSYPIASAAVMTTPTPGSTLSGTAVTFSWSAGSGVAQYWLYVGTTGVGSLNLVNADMGTTRFRNVSNLPSAGTVYVRLWSRIGSVWQTRDYTYTAGGAGLALMTSPAPGATLNGSGVTFEWSAGTGVSQYWLYVGTTGVGSLNIHSANTGSVRFRSVPNMPTSGTIYVRLWSLQGGNWRFNDYVFTGSGAGLATMTSPTPGSGLQSTSATFSWSAGTNVSQYWLAVGTTGAGAGNVLNTGTGTSTTRTVTGLPSSGPVYVRLWSLQGGTWRYNDYAYAAGGSFTAGQSTASLTAVSLP